MSMLLWAYVVNQGSGAGAQNLLQVALDYRHVPSGLTVKGPEQVAVRLWGVVRKNATVKAYVDLSGYDEGTFEVPVQIEPGSGAILTSIQPRKVQIDLTSMQEQVFAVSHQVVQGPPGGYELLDISITPDKCVARGEEGIISKIDRVVGQVDLSQATDITAYTVDLEARDIDGNPVGSGVDLRPRQAILHAVIALRQEWREVPVTVIIAGQAAPGFRVTAVSVQPDTVKVMGNIGTVTGIEDIKTELVDLAEKKVPFQMESTMQTPPGIKVFPARVTVNVTIGSITANEENQE